MEFKSQFDIGDPVKVFGQKGHVRTVTFTSGKVRYSIVVLVDENDDVTTIHNIDSSFVEQREGEKMDMGFDNYS